MKVLEYVVEPQNILADESFSISIAVTACSSQTSVCCFNISEVKKWALETRFHFGILYTVMSASVGIQFMIDINKYLQSTIPT